MNDAQADECAAPVLTAEQVLQRRIDGLRTWLHNNAPECFTEQMHVRNGTSERAYWHYGYLVALRDMRALLFDVDQDKN